MLKRCAILFALTAVLVGTAACTVQPLYGQKTSAVEINNVSIAEVDSRVAQQVRNRLLFLLNGSGSKPVNPDFDVSLTIRSNARGVLSASTEGDGSDISARRIEVVGRMAITDVETGKIAKVYRRVQFASFDTSSQQFANSRALIDAENRAASELAEDFRNLIFSFIKRR